MQSTRFSFSLHHSQSEVKLHYLLLLSIVLTAIASCCSSSTAQPVEQPSPLSFPSTDHERHNDLSSTKFSNSPINPAYEQSASDLIMNDLFSLNEFSSFPLSLTDLATTDSFQLTTARKPKRYSNKTSRPVKRHNQSTVTTDFQTLIINLQPQLIFKLYLITSFSKLQLCRQHKFVTSSLYDQSIKE